MWRTGPPASRHVGSSQTRVQTRVPCIGRWILNHCATREALSQIILMRAPLSLVRRPLPIHSHSANVNFPKWKSDHVTPLLKTPQCSLPTTESSASCFCSYLPLATICCHPPTYILHPSLPALCHTLYFCNFGLLCPECPPTPLVQS